MFTKVTTTNVDRKYFCRVGLSSDLNQYVYAGHDNIYIQSSLKYRIFSNFHTVRYLRNIFPYSKTSTSQIFDFRYYPGNSVLDWVSVWTDVPTNYMLGYELPSSVNFAYYDVSTRTLYTDIKTVYNYPVNEAEIFYFGSKNLSLSNFMHLFNGLVYFNLYPQYETILHPFTLSVSMKSLASKVDKGSTIPFVAKTTLTSVNKTYTLTAPKYVVWFMDKYYVYDNVNSWQELTPSAPPYLTRAEVESNGMLTNEVNDIPEAEWQNLLGNYESCLLLCNGYMTPIVIRHKYWMNNYDVMQFLWRFSRQYKETFLVGDI